MNPLKLAVVGGGPSAFYVASRILKLLPESAVPNLRIHLFDRLWAPHGLVRYGVAPDHPEVKPTSSEVWMIIHNGFRAPANNLIASSETGRFPCNCTNKFDQTAEDARFQFFGNVNVGSSASSILDVSSLPLSSIFQNYSHVLFATGCTLPTLHAALPPSAHCIPALSLVHWYTQHPNAPAPPRLDKMTHVSIIGNGNVSLDVARMLLTNVDVLSKYDVPLPVLEVLSRSTIKHVSIIGRRGALEAAFTMKELREMINLPEASMVPLPATLLSPSSNSSLTRQQTRVLQLLKQGSKNPYGSTSKTWSLDFFRSPIGITPPSPSSLSSKLSLSHTILDPTTQRAVPTGETTTIPTHLVVTSLGFHGEPTAEFYDPTLRHLRTIGGRIVTAKGETLRNVYASGWASTGAKGVLASTMMDAYAVADTIISDWKAGGSEGRAVEGSSLGGDIPKLNTEPLLDSFPKEIEKGLEEGVVTRYDDWKRIDAEEVERGRALGKERERMGWSDVQHLLKK